MLHYITVLFLKYDVCIYIYTHTHTHISYVKNNTVIQPRFFILVTTIT
jgi:hypothetical protein